MTTQQKNALLLGKTTMCRDREVLPEQKMGTKAHCPACAI